jgi:general secretion pathway protein H
MSSRSGLEGFTLIEVLAVMLIVASVAALAITMTPGTGRASLRAVTLQVASLMRRERLDAVLTGQSRDVALDGQRRALVGDGGLSVVIPRDVVVDVLGVDELWAGRLAIVRFQPDGASSGAVLRLSREGAEYEIRVNWFMGAVVIDPP